MILPDIIKVILLGLVEGLTEFLPISSTGHLIVATSLLDFRSQAGTTFEIFIQIGAVIAVVLYYRADLLRQARSLPSDVSVQHFWMSILIAFIPAALIGFLLSSKIDELLFRPAVVAVTLIVGGVIFLFVERGEAFRSINATSLTQISYRQAFMIGIAQVAALVPGVSRSGASIVGGLLSGLDRPTATQFSFYLAIPTLGAASLYSLVKNLNQIQSGDWFNLIVGALVSAVVAWIAVRWLLTYVSRNSFIVFGYYRIIAGGLILLLIALNVIKG